MTGEPMHTASKERMAPELMSSSAPAIKNCFKSAVAIILRFQLCSARYTAPQTKNSRNASATIQSPRKYDDLHASNYQLLPRCSGHYALLLVTDNIYVAHGLEMTP